MDLKELVKKSGGVRAAEELIKSVRGVSPSKSAIDRATRGYSTPYAIQCMFDDLNIALEHKINIDDD